MFLQEDRQEKMAWLRTEMKIAEIESQLRKILHPGKPDLESIIEHLQELNSLLVRSLRSQFMRINFFFRWKKHVHILSKLLDLYTKAYTGCSIWVITKVNEYYDYIFGVCHISLQI